MNKFLNSALLAATVVAGYATSALASASTNEPIPVPEPTALGLLTMGVAGIVLARRLRNK